MEACSIYLAGPDASIKIERFAFGIYEIRYDFYAYPVDKNIEEAAGLFYDPELSSQEDGFSYTEEKSGVIIAYDPPYNLEIDCQDGIVSLKQDNLLLHGGPIGSSDTVLPRYPLRVHGKAPLHVHGTFNFPLDPDDRFFGLGDKCGDLDRRNRRFMMHNRDALGYRGSFADPLYKSIPFVIKWNPKKKTWLGIAVTAPDVTAADFGVESQYYYSFSLKNGPFRYLLFTSKNYHEIIEKYTRITGRPAFPPAFTFGFLGSSMDYSEPDDAEKRIQTYLNTIEKEGIPCEGLYLSSGYYKSETNYRHTFLWNKNKFPDPGSFIGGIRKKGYHLACNVKPGILVNHPQYEEYAAAGVFIPDIEGKPYTDFYWGANASFWNFADSGAEKVWRNELNKALFEMNVDGVWNDNNEFEIEDSSVPSYSCRSTFSLRMAAASYAEAKKRNPAVRPWIISRSGCIGIQRYARTWTGDNISTWESLRYNLLQGSSLGLSGIPFFGHDVGGFFGDSPDSEQFLRWCQAAVFQPRFVIHSWNSDSKPTELWSYPDIFTSLKHLVRQHYEFMPYTYSNAYRAHITGLPIQRPLVLEFPGDNIPSDLPAYLYGDAILVLPAVAPEQTDIAVPLPSCVWFDPDTGEYITGGKYRKFSLTDDRTRYLVRMGSIVARTESISNCDRGWSNNLIFDLFPGEKKYCWDFFEDDGRSALSEKNWRSFKLSITPLKSGLWMFRLKRKNDSNWNPLFDERVLRLMLPPGFCFTGSGESVKIIDFGPKTEDVELAICQK